MSSPEDDLRDYYAKLGDSPALEPVKQAVVKIMDNIFKHGMTPKDAINMSEDTMESFYTEGYRLYQSGRYDDAMKMFRFLGMLDPTSIRYWLGMAACMHQKKCYPEAAMLYQLCGLADPTDPIPYYYMGDCYGKMNQFGASKQCLKLCIQHCAGKEKYAQVQDRAKLMLKELQPNESKQTEKQAPSS